MIRLVGNVLMVIGALMLLGQSVSTTQSTDPGELASGFGFSLFTLCLGYILFRQKRPLTGSSAGPVWIEVLDDPHPWADALAARHLRVSASALIVLGIIIMFVGSSCIRIPQIPKIASVIGWLFGWTFYIWGCVNLARWKGRPALVGALGYLMLPGVIILACLPNRRQRLLGLSYEESKTDLIAIAKRDRSFGIGYLLMAPSVVLIGCMLALFFYRQSTPTGSGEWKEFVAESAGFRASMPGEPLVESKRERVQAGAVELKTYSLWGREHRDLYMIVAARLPQGLPEDRTRTFKLYNVGKSDILGGWPGATVQSEKFLHIDDLNILELIVVHKTGGILKARIYATKTDYYKVIVQTSPDRVDSAEVTQFFDSFSLLGNVANVGKPVKGKTTPWGF